MRTEGSGNQKPRGITPTTVRGVPSSVTRVPMMDESPPISCHKPKLDDRHRLGARHIVACVEAASEEGLHAEHIEQLCRRGDTGHQPRGPSPSRRIRSR